MSIVVSLKSIVVKLWFQMLKHFVIWNELKTAQFFQQASLEAFLEG